MSDVGIGGGAATPADFVLRDTKVVRGYPLVGGLFDVLQDAPRFMMRVARERPGEIVGFRLGPITVYLVTHPDHVQHVFQEWRSCGKGGMWKAVRALGGNGLVTSEGDFWLRQRRLMQPLFHAARLAGLTDLMVDVIDREVSHLVARGAEATVDMHREMMAMTQRVILETMFGPGIARSETERLRDALLIALEVANVRLFLYFLPDRLPRPGERRWRTAIGTIDEALLRLVRARRASGVDRDDVLGLLLRARDEETGEPMDERQLRDELVTMFVAGNETTGNAMTWLWYLLCQSPEVERRLRAEVADVLGGRRPTFEDLARLNYTRQVFQEVMRLYPPGWFLPRFTGREMVIGGHRIPAGSTILLSAFVSQRDPAFWPDPELFDPERFTPERSAGRPRYAYYPFGRGPRQCIGNHFAMMEAQLITAMMVQRARPLVVPGHRVVPSSAFSLKPRYGMMMTLGSPPRH